MACFDCIVLFQLKLPHGFNPRTLFQAVLVQLRVDSVSMAFRVSQPWQMNIFISSFFPERCRRFRRCERPQKCLGSAAAWRPLETKLDELGVNVSYISVPRASALAHSIARLRLPSIKSMVSDHDLLTELAPCGWRTLLDATEGQRLL